MRNKLVIGIDCWALRLNGGGARFVFESLLEHFRHSKHTFILFLHVEAYQCVEDVQSRIGILRNFIRIKIDNPNHIFLYKKYVDIFYCPFNNISARFLDKPIVSLLHDIQECFLPNLFTLEELKGRQENYSDILRCSDKTITVSEFCKRSFSEYHNADPSRIEVVYNAAQEAVIYYSKQTSIKISSGKFLFLKNKEYIVYPANFYPHKNHATLIKAYKLASRKGIDLPDLVFVGKTWGGKDCPTSLINSFNLANKIHTVNDIAPKELAFLYRNCKFVVLPTLFEGFCLPAVEALAFGKVLACSNLEILREVTSGQAIFFQPDSETSILNALQEASKLVEEEHRHPNLFVVSSHKRMEVSSHYSWKRSADLTLEIIEKTYYEHESNNDGYSINWLFNIVYHGEPIQWLFDTINSICEQNFYSDNLNILIANFSSDNSIGSHLNDLYNYNIEVYDGYENPPSYLLNYLTSNTVFLNIFAGNVLSESSSKNIKKKFSKNPHLALLLGEVLQVHEDENRTFERYNYFRLIDNKLILEGTLYSEMLILRNPELDLFEDDWLNFWDLNRILVSCNNLAEAIFRFTVAQVRFRSTLHLGREEKIFDALRYDPQKTFTFLRKEQALSQRHFLEFINTKIANSLSCETPAMTTEISKVLQGEN